MMNDFITGLNDLMELLTDSHLGYKEAADRAHDLRVKRMLLDMSARRAPMLVSLGQELLRVGEDVPDAGTIKGSLHRAWMDVRAALTSADDSAMLDECERGENYLIGRYEAVMKNEHITPQLRDKLANEVAQVRLSVAAVEDLKQEMLQEHK